MALLSGVFDTLKKASTVVALLPALMWYTVVDENVPDFLIPNGGGGGGGSSDTIVIEVPVDIPNPSLWDKLAESLSDPFIIVMICGMFLGVALLLRMVRKRRMRKYGEWY